MEILSQTMKNGRSIKWFIHEKYDRVRVFVVQAVGDDWATTNYLLSKDLADNVVQNQH